MAGMMTVRICKKRWPLKAVFMAVASCPITPEIWSVWTFGSDWRHWAKVERTSPPEPLTMCTFTTLDDTKHHEPCSREISTNKFVPHICRQVRILDQPPTLRFEVP